MPHESERRSSSPKLEVRAARGGKGPGTLVGYAATFDQLSMDLGGFREKIAKGAFRKALLTSDCRCLANHSDEAILGRQSAGTLRLKEDAIGLWFECDLPDTAVGRDTAASVRRRDMQGCSFQFTFAEGGEEWDFQTSPPTRTITAIGQLFDVGPVTFPAYESTKVDMRAFRAAQHRRPMSIARARLRLAEVYLL